MAGANDDHVFRHLQYPPRKFTIDFRTDDGMFKYAVRHREEGVRIVGIKEGGPYHRAGAVCGHLTMINDTPVYTEDDIKAVLVNVSNAGATAYTIHIIPDPTVPPMPPFKPPASEKDDFIFRPLDGHPRVYTVEQDYPGEDGKFVYTARRPEEGIRIIEIMERGPYHKAGVPCGHITKIEGQPIRVEADIKRIMQELKDMGRTSYTVEVTADPQFPPLPPYRDPNERKPSNNTTKRKGIVDDDIDSLQDPEEYLAERLHEVAVLRRRGALPEEEYQKIRTKIVKLLTGGENQGSNAPKISPAARLPPQPPQRCSCRDDEETRSGYGGVHAAPYDWAEVVSSRYIYLRERPSRGSRWVTGGAANGYVEVLQVVDPDWVLCRLDSGAEGYLREQHVRYLAGGRPPRPPRRAGGGASGVNIFEDIIAEVLNSETALPLQHASSIASSVDAASSSPIWGAHPGYNESMSNEVAWLNL